VVGDPGGPVDVTVGVEGGGGDGARSLRAWLVGEEQLRGRVRLLEATPDPGRLGPGVDGLVVALAPGGAASVLAAVAVAWVRAQRADVTVTVERPDGSTVRLEGRRVRGLDAAAARDLVEQAGRALDGSPPVTGERDGG
jgi:hypothetical protein